MPYIGQDRREDLLSLTIPKLGDAEVNTSMTPGELNFLLTEVALEYVRSKGLNYTAINDVMGAFASAQAEFYRRVAVPYEDAKIRENGDVYPTFVDGVASALKGREQYTTARGNIVDVPPRVVGDGVGIREPRQPLAGTSPGDPAAVRRSFWFGTDGRMYEGSEPFTGMYNGQHFDNGVNQGFAISGELRPGD